MQSTLLNSLKFRIVFTDFFLIPYGYIFGTGRSPEEPSGGTGTNCASVWGIFGIF